MDEWSETILGSVSLWLTVYADQVPARSVEVGSSRFVIGREETCDLVISDPKVSREHAEIVDGPGPFRTLRDLGSANGTLVNGRPLRTPTGFATGGGKESTISGGEWIQVGDTKILVSLGVPPTGAGEAPPGESEPEGT